MRALILTLGTRGDLELFLILGQALAARGHEVAIASSDFNAAAVARRGLGFHAVGAGTRDVLISALRSAGETTDLVERTRRFYEGWLRPQLGVALSRISGPAATCDVFVSNLKLVLRRGSRIIPGVSVTYDPPLNSEDLPRFGPARAEVLDLVAMPRELVDPQNRWGSQYRFTGFWTPPADAEAIDLSPRLRAFLEAGPPPIVITLGSMAFGPAREFATLVRGALTLIGRRGIVVRGWSDLAVSERDEHDWLVVDEAPYESLFVGAAAVVHHGGIGTLAAVLRAGQTSIILPQVACQRALGEMLCGAGMASGVLTPRELTPERLAESIDAAISDRSLRQNAIDWRQRLRNDDGAATAAQLIEAHVEGLRRG